MSRTAMPLFFLRATAVTPGAGIVAGTRGFSRSSSGGRGKRWPAWRALCAPKLDSSPKTSWLSKLTSPMLVLLRRRAAESSANIGARGSIMRLASGAKSGTNLDARRRPLANALLLLPASCVVVVEGVGGATCPPHCLFCRACTYCVRRPSHPPTTLDELRDDGASSPPRPPRPSRLGWCTGLLGPGARHRLSTIPILHATATRSSVKHGRFRPLLAHPTVRVILFFIFVC
ncbi:hypothetical protein C8R45DRAFT_1037566 [Mycena sanguinolenta]|nr:hypothetical protein C8R45DRAFT_1037566 [Mycena sanguinolenta]